MNIEYVVLGNKELATNFPELSYCTGVKMKLYKYQNGKGSIFEVANRSETIDVDRLNRAYQEKFNIPALSLSQYLSQIDPIKMPIVMLQENDYTVELRYMHRRTIPCASILIHAFPDTQYVQIGDTYQLQAIDKDGINRGNSCFWLPKTENKND